MCIQKQAAQNTRKTKIFRFISWPFNESFISPVNITLCPKHFFFNFQPNMHITRKYLYRKSNYLSKKWCEEEVKIFAHRPNYIDLQILATYYIITYNNVYQTFLYGNNEGIFHISGIWHGIISFSYHSHTHMAGMLHTRYHCVQK